MIDLVHFNHKGKIDIKYRGPTWGLVSLEVSMIWKVNSKSVRKSDYNFTLAVL